MNKMKMKVILKKKTMKNKKNKRIMNGHIEFEEFDRSEEDSIDFTIHLNRFNVTVFVIVVMWLAFMIYYISEIYSTICQ